MKKLCKLCNVEKVLQEFHNGDGKFKKKNICKICTKAHSREYYNKNRLNILKKRNKYNKQNREIVNTIRRKSYMRNIIKENERSREYKKRNKEKINLSRREYHKMKMASSPEYRIKENIRKKLHKSLNSKIKSKTLENLLQCSIKELKLHLESKFKTEMSWENYGFYGWHIDHIRPLASFDLTNKEELKQAWHYNNLQPLWAKENLSKGKKCDLIRQK